MNNTIKSDVRKNFQEKQLEKQADVDRKQECLREITGVIG